MSFQDKTLTCRDCGTSFTWTAGEQEFYSGKGLLNAPSRCPDCRAANKSSRNSGSGGSRGGAGGSRGYNSGPRQMYPVTCDSCGQQTEVPFQPRGDKPVYCSSCFEKIQGGARRS